MLDDTFAPFPLGLRRALVMQAWRAGLRSVSTAPLDPARAHATCLETVIARCSGDPSDVNALAARGKYGTRRTPSKTRRERPVPPPTMVLVGSDDDEVRVERVGDPLQLRGRVPKE